MTADAGLIGASAADLVERYGSPVVLARATGAFDASTQAAAPGEVRVALRAVLRHRSRRGEGDGSVRDVEAILPAAALAATAFPDPPMPGDRLEVDGEERAVVSVETLSVAGAPAIHLLRLGR